ncbi:MAG TPA: hypothetical protein VMT03_07260 [Polyangia bacterium]|nr:hypothetical protein [Polyangia bacterium]
MISPRLLASTALCLTAAVTPLVAHAIGSPCWIFLPAHVPVLLAGLALGPMAGLAAGASTAASDFLFGGRVHGVSFLPLAFEFLTYGVMAGGLSPRTARYPRLLGALVVAMLAGRCAHFAVAALLGRKAQAVAKGLFLVPWPGIALQLLALPLVAEIIRRRLSRR